MAVVADLHRVGVWCEGRLVADHRGSWTWHQSISDPEHVAAARALRYDRLELLQPVADPEVEIRCLADYDVTLGPDESVTGGGVMATRTTARDRTAVVSFLTRALKAPTLREPVRRLAQRVRAESWLYEEFLVACLQREVAAREYHGGEGRIRGARFPARKSLDEFDLDLTHPVPARPTSPLGWPSGSARTATACCSPPANLFFQPAGTNGGRPHRHQQKVCGRWGEVFGDEDVSAGDPIHHSSPKWVDLNGR